MPFQAIPIAMRANTGSPLAKLVYIWLVNQCWFEDAPNGKGFVSFEMEELEKFAQASDADCREALEHLRKLALITGFETEFNDFPGTCWVDVNLPMSNLQREERRRFKASPDQMELLEERCNLRCAACGVSGYRQEVEWHADHIIPQSIGGADVEENMQLLCQACNSRKGNRVHFVDFLSGRPRK